jgi:hypothetical protein
VHRVDIIDAELAQAETGCREYRVRYGLLCHMRWFVLCGHNHANDPSEWPDHDTGRLACLHGSGSRQECPQRA